MRLEIGSRLGPYEITGWIGAGGMGEVYRARDGRLGREVAIKVLPRDVLRDADRLTRFQREASSASALNHRNIVTVHDFTCTDEEAWLVMELISGETVRETLARGSMSLKKILSVGTGIAQGLAAAHQAGIVHRDLKPENVMVAADGTPKILDFGLVKQTAAMSDPNSPTQAMVSSTGVVMGTAAYMSPEQARGEELDFRTDHFSLGMVLHEMASGQHPFSKPTGIATLAAILSEEPRPLGEDVPYRLREIIERCLSKNPRDRYGSTEDLAHDLAHVTSAPHRPAHVLAAEGSTRRSWPLIAGAALLAAVVAALAVYASMRRGPVTPAPSYQAAVATPELSQIFRDEIGQSVAVSPDGRYVVVYGRDEDSAPVLWLHDLRTGAKRLLAENAFTVGWSPDSKSIAYFADAKLMTVAIAGGPPRTVCAARPEGLPVWQGDTLLFAQFSAKPPGIYRVNANGGTPQLVVGATRSPRSSLPMWPAFLPDGKHFLYMTILQATTADGNIDHAIYVGSLDGAPPRKVPATIDSRVVYVNGSLFFVRDGTLLAQPFDYERMTFSGEPTALVTGLHYFRSTGMAAFSVSDNGVLVWRDAIAGSRLVWLDRAGMELQEVATGAFSADGRLSPDGRKYAVGLVDPKEGVADVWLYDLERDSSERVTFRTLDEKAPVWSADGQTLFYRSDGGGGPPDIYRWDAAVQAGEVICSGPGVEQAHDVARDGSKMLYVERRQGAEEDIYLLPMQPKGPPRAWRATSFDESSPRFSPDGKWVAYQSNFSGRPEVYVSALDSASTHVRISRNGGTLPRWSRTGQELFFLAPAGRLMTASIQNGSTTSVPKTLFQAPEAVTFEPSNDGTKFLVQLEQRTTEPQVKVLINWQDRIQANTAAAN